MKQSISKKISVILVCMLTLSSLAIGVFSYVFHRTDSIKASSARALAIAQSAAAAVNPQQFQQILQTGEKNDFWHAYKTTLDGINTKTDVAYLYVLDNAYSNKVNYFAEGVNPANTAETLDLGAQEDAADYAPEMFDTLRTGAPSTTNIYSSGEFGRMVSGFAPILDANGSVIGVAGADISVEDVLAASNAFALKVALLVAAFSILFGVLSVLIMNRLIGKPILQLTKASAKISKGDLQVTLENNSQDEIGRLSRSFEEMVSSTQKQVDILEDIANGDLTVEVSPRSEQDAMSHAMLRTIQSLNHMFTKVHNGSAQVSQGALQISDGAQNLAHSSTQQAANMEDLVASIASIAQKTQDNADKAQQATKLAQNIKASAQKGTGQMQDMLQAVQDIDHANQSIQKVIKVIDDIAFQTNILALNAAVEAARAGQYGKGFAVVADEVRSLAAKSADSAKSTATLIAASVQKANQGVHIAQATATSLDEIVAGIQQSSQLISGIAQASAQQGTDIQEMNHSISQVAKAVQQTSATAQQSAAASEEMSSQSTMLESLLADFKLKQNTPPPQAKALHSSNYSVLPPSGYSA